MTTADTPADPARRQRFLEGWLPLAQEASTRYGWGLDGPALEALLLRAAPALLHARSAIDACAILWATYSRHTHGEPSP
jgi:hypothetical protein